MKPVGQDKFWSTFEAKQHSYLSRTTLPFRVFGIACQDSDCIYTLPKHLRKPGLAELRIVRFDWV